MKTSKKFQDKMKEIAKLYDLEFGGGPDETRLFKPNNINVFANLIKKTEYKKMQNTIDKAVIDKPNYTIYAWNDISGFEYWKEEGENNSSNYIMVCADIKSLEGLNIQDLIDDLEEVESNMSIFDNTDEYYWSKQG